MCHNSEDVNLIEAALPVMYNPQNYINTPGCYSATLSIKQNGGQFEYLYLHELSNRKNVYGICFKSNSLFQIEPLFSFFEKLFSYSIEHSYCIECKIPKLGVVFNPITHPEQKTEFKDYVLSEYRKGELLPVKHNMAITRKPPLCNNCFVQLVPCNDDNLPQHIQSYNLACYFKLYDDKYLKTDNLRVIQTNQPIQNNSPIITNSNLQSKIANVLSIIFFLGVGLVILSLVVAFRNKDFATKYPVLYILAAILVVSGGIYKLVQWLKNSK